jgi:hypothetical protein
MPAVKEITFSFAPRLATLQWTRHTCSLGRFVERFRAARVYPSKDALPRWCAASLRDGYRRLTHVRAVHCLALDFDGASAAAVQEAIDGVLGFVHTTWSHTPDEPRCRAVLFLDRWLSAEEHGRVFRWCAARAERRGLSPDYAARTAVHPWACPGIPDGGVYEFRELVGPPLDVARVLEQFPAEQPEEPQRPFPTSSPPDRVERARRWLAAVDGAVSGQGGHAQTFHAALGLVRGFQLDEATALRLLVEEYNDRCAPKWTPWELRHKVRQAKARGQREPGYLLNAPMRRTG